MNRNQKALIIPVSVHPLIFLVLNSRYANILYFFFMLKNISEYDGKYENTRCCITEILYLKLLCGFKHCTHCTVCML